ncbi:MAG: dihydrodipicolinate synthase family protein [Chthonomonadales bacterium]|nr:dihydrodipicolinate synthase family protein [Chthonomonadales bacterium]
MTAFRGLMVATLTPFDGNDRIDPGALRRHVEFLVGEGVAALCPVGTTGEFLYLTAGEKVRVVEETVAAAAGRVPVVAGVWGLRPRETALLCRAARAAGADAVFLPPPIYYPASDDAIHRHYAAAAADSELPVFAYNIPAYAGNALSSDLVERLVADRVIAGIKDSSAKSDRMAELVSRFSGRIAVEAASDSFAAQARELGADGFISALANIWPAAFRRLWDGETSLQPAVDAARDAVKRAGGIAALKHLLGLRGFAFGDSRLPYSALSEEARAALAGAFQAASGAGMA